MKKITLRLVGLDGNAFSLMGAFSKQARREGWSKDEIKQVIDDAMSGDYDHLLGVISDHCVDPDDEDDPFLDDDDERQDYEDEDR